MGNTRKTSLLTSFGRQEDEERRRSSSSQEKERIGERKEKKAALGPEVDSIPTCV